MEKESERKGRDKRERAMEGVVREGRGEDGGGMDRKKEGEMGRRAKKEEKECGWRLPGVLSTSS